MKLSEFAPVLALFGFAVAAMAQQPSPATPPKPVAPAPPALAPVTSPESNLGPDAVVLTIGNLQMTRAQFEVLLSALASNGRPATSPSAKAASRGTIRRTRNNGSGSPPAQAG